jgi:autotransporter-associated beta strand protein
VAVSVDPGLGDIDVKEGMFAIQTVTSQVGNPARTITVFPGATMELWNLNTAPLNKRMVLSNTATLFNENGNSILVGPVVLTNGVSTFNIGGTSVTMSNNVLSGPGGLIKIGAGTLTLRGVNTYTGPTLLSAGTLALAASGSISGSPSITISAGATLDVSGRADGTLTLSSGQTLSGGGTINGSLVAGPGAIVSPGNSMSVLTVTNVVSLAGNTLMELNKAAATNDSIQGAAKIIYGGTLRLTNVGGTFAAGDNFKLFSAGIYSGVFSNLTPVIPALNLAWNTNTLTTDGTLRIVSASTAPPRITSFASSGGNLVIAGTNGVPGWTYYVLAATNLGLPAASWTRISTNQFDALGSFSITNTRDGSVLQRFYRLQLQ